MHAIHKKYVSVILFFLMAIALIFGFQNCGFPLKTEAQKTESHSSKEQRTNSTTKNRALRLDSIPLFKNQNYKFLSESI